MEGEGREGREGGERREGTEGRERGRGEERRDRGKGGRDGGGRREGAEGREGGRGEWKDLGHRLPVVQQAICIGAHLGCHQHHAVVIHHRENTYELLNDGLRSTDVHHHHLAVPEVLLHIHRVCGREEGGGGRREEGGGRGDIMHNTRISLTFLNLIQDLQIATSPATSAGPLAVITREASELPRNAG